MTAQLVKVEENQWGETEMPAVCSHAAGIPDGQTAVQESQEGRDALNLFLQKPSAASPKLSHLSGVTATVEDSKKPSNNACSPNILVATPHLAGDTRHRVTENAGASGSSPLGRSPWMTCSPQSFLQEEQFSKMVAEKSSQWFSLLPRSPCDESSVTSGSSPANSASSPVPVFATKSPSLSSSLPYGQFGAATSPGIKSAHTLISEVSRCSCVLHYLPPKEQFEFLIPATVFTAHSDMKKLRMTCSHRHKQKQHKSKN